MAETAEEKKEEGGGASAPAAGPAAETAEKEEGGGGFTRRVFSRGQTLAKEGEKGECAFVIKRGKVEVRKGVRTTSPQLLNTLGPGNVVAEFALFDGLPHSADVIAAAETEVVALSREEFQSRLRAMDPVLRTALMGLMAKARHMVELAAEEEVETRARWRNTAG